MKRVVITGIGTVSPIGNNTDVFWKNLQEGNTGVAPITRFDASQTGITVAAEVKEFDPTFTMDRKEYRRMDLFSQYGIAASVEAHAMSGYDIASNAHRVGVLVSSGIGGLVEIENGIRKIFEKDWLAMQKTNISTRKANIISTMFDYYKHGVAQEHIIGNAWGAYNAITGYYCNVKKQEGEKRMDNLVFGGDRLAMNRALNMVTMYKAA